MSFWLRPTTADVGLRSFAPSKARLFEETTAGMQDYLLASEIPPKAIHHTSVWTVHIPVHDDSNGLLLVKWLEEVLFMDEVEQKWLVDCSIKIEELEGELSLQAHVRWVNSDEIEKEVEIKAVTRQDLMVAEVTANQTLESPWPEVPTFEGPGWYSDVVFDI
jgi:SHS2 domain-containing protein